MVSGCDPAALPVSTPGSGAVAQGAGLREPAAGLDGAALRVLEAAVAAPGVVEPPVRVRRQGDGSCPGHEPLPGHPDRACLRGTGEPVLVDAGHLHVGHAGRQCPAAAVATVPLHSQVRVEHLVRAREHDLAGGVADPHGRLDHLRGPVRQGRRVVHGRGPRVDGRVGDRCGPAGGIRGVRNASPRAGCRRCRPPMRRCRASRGSRRSERPSA